MQGLGCEQGMKRVDAEHRCLARTGRVSEARKVAEVADPPICRAAQTVKLAAQAPFAAAGSEFGRKVAPFRSDDQTELSGNTAGFEVESVVTERQSIRQRHWVLPTL